MVGLFIIAITAMFTIPVVLKDPLAARRMVIFANDIDIVAAQQFQKQGIASFGLIHAFPFLCPLLVLHIKTGRNYLFKIFSAVVLLVTYLMIVKVSFAIPLILSTFAIVYAFILTENKRRNLVIGVVMICALSVLLNKDLVTFSLDIINRSFFDDTPISEKIDDIILSIEYKQSDGQVSDRGDLYKKSWHTFFESPIYGNLDKTNAGGHAYFVDRLAYFGLFGVLPFFIFLFFAIKRSLLNINREMRLHYILGVASFIFLGFTKNISGIENFLYLFVLLPGLCLIGRPVKDNRDAWPDRGGRETCNFAKY